MTEQLMILLDEHKTEMPEGCYVEACRLLHNIHHTKPKEVMIYAICAECIAQGYYCDDELCVASKVQQRILQVKCTPVQDSEKNILRFKTPTELLEIGKYRESWITEWRDDRNQHIPEEKYPIRIHCNNDVTSVVIYRVEYLNIKKRAHIE